MTYFIRTVASADVIEIIMMIIHLPSFLPSEVNVHRRANLLYSIREQRGGGSITIDTGSIDHYCHRWPEGLHRRAASYCTGRIMNPIDGPTRLSQFKQYIIFDCRLYWKKSSSS